MQSKLPHPKLPHKLLGSQYGLFYVSLVLLACSLVVLAFALRAERQASAHTAHVQTPFGLNQTVTMGSATVRVGQVSYDKGNSVFSAPSGYHYLILTLTVRNKSDKPIQIIPTTDTYVKDATGHVTYLTPFVLSKPFRSGELLPGEQISGQLSYLVSKNAQPKFYVDAIWSGGVLPFRI